MYINVLHSPLNPISCSPTGKWDPERWFMGNRNDRPLPLDDPRPKRQQDDTLVTHSKRKSSDPKERIKEEKDDIVLSPQRRSFGTGCHVIPQSSLARRPGSPTDGRESDRWVVYPIYNYYSTSVTVQELSQESVKETCIGILA